MTHNRRQRWTEEADAELRRRIVERQALVVIAREMGRTQDGIRGRAGELGLTLRSTIRPWRAGVKLGPKPKRPSSAELEEL